MTTHPKGGRPPIGPQIHIRLPVDLLRAVDAYAQGAKVTRAEAIRRLLERALDKGRGF